MSIAPCHRAFVGWCRLVLAVARRAKGARVPGVAQDRARSVVLLGEGFLGFRTLLLLWRGALSRALGLGRSCLGHGFQRQQQWRLTASMPSRTSRSNLEPQSWRDSHLQLLLPNQEEVDENELQNTDSKNLQLHGRANSGKSATQTHSKRWKHQKSWTWAWMWLKWHVHHNLQKHDLLEP